MVDVVKNKNYFDVIISAKEPALAKNICLAIIEELDLHQRKYNKMQTSEAKNFIESRIFETEKELKNAEEDLKNFRDRNK